MESEHEQRMSGIAALQMQVWKCGRGVFFFVGEGVIELHHKDALQNDFFLKVGGHSKKVM